MNAQDLILGTRVAHLRELKTEVERLKAENAALRNENGSLRNHLDLAHLALADLKDGEGLEIWDGWNLILGANRIAKDRADLIAQAKATGRRVWIVFDGPKASVSAEGSVRVSYTGGTGEHRADRFIADFVRAAAYLGLASGITVLSYDKDFLSTIAPLTAGRG